MRVEALVAGGGEQGLLGLAFHPDFARNGRFFLNATEARDGRRRARHGVTSGAPPGAAFAAGPFTRERVLLEVPQPYANHNGGGLVFGPDGRLYVGMGDGGSAGDPEGHGQRSDSLLGKMLRLDVDAASDGPAPRSVFARGLRNPWRFSFDPRGRLVVGDVGQDRFEEIDLVPEGANLGWNVREGRVCFRPDDGCSDRGFLGPVHVYGREDGVSVTGGVVYQGNAIPELRDRYVFGDFGSGRLWALRLPETAGAAAPPPDALGRFGLSVSCIARDAKGELLVCDHGGGRIWRVEARRSLLDDRRRPSAALRRDRRQGAATGISNGMAETSRSNATFATGGERSWNRPRTSTVSSSNRSRSSAGRGSRPRRTGWRPTHTTT